MIPFETYSDSHPFYKSEYLLAISSEKLLFFTQFRQTCPSRPVLTFVMMSGLYVIIPSVFGVGIGVGVLMWRMCVRVGSFGFQ